jgi:hypothetical protein
MVLMELETKSDEELLAVIREASALLDARQPKPDGPTYHITVQAGRKPPYPIGRISKFTRVDGCVVEVPLLMLPVGKTKTTNGGDYQVADGDVICKAYADGKRAE